MRSWTCRLVILGGAIFWANHIHDNTSRFIFIVILLLTLAEEA